MPIEQRLSEQVIDQLVTKLPFTPEQAASVRSLWSERTTLVRDLGTFLSTNNDAISGISQSLERLAGVREQAFSSLNQHINGYRTSTRPEVVIDRIRRRIFTHPDFRPPWGLGFLRLFALQGPHPVITASEDAYHQAQRVAEEESPVKLADLDRLKRSKDEVVRDRENKINDRDNRFLAAAKRTALERDKVEIFVGIIPWQAEQIVAEEIRRLLVVGQSFANFPDFVTFMQGTQDQVQMTQELFAKLDLRVKAAWEAFLVYRRLQELAAKGLTEEPTIPNVLSRFRGRLPL